MKIALNPFGMKDLNLNLNLSLSLSLNLNLLKYLLIVPILILSATILDGQSSVTIEEKPLVIPTYQVAPPDKNPIFYTGRVYQGAQGFIYPHPLYDVLTDVRKDQVYKAVYLNNEYLDLCVLPELGGRIFSATDKSDKYDFFYHQHVIKPSLIGMIGAWISGGVEWNIPDHHRATSQLPVDYTMADNSDGSKTVWVGETELSRGLKWTVGLTLYPGKSYIEATVKVINPTPFIHSFLYWANVSVHCNENYQVIFPPNTQYGVHHAKEQFINWPIGQGFYGGIDRTGVDMSWWKNHLNPTSIFAWNFTDDFLAGYDFGKDAGTVHVANHHIVTGKKFFLWGNNAEAKMWEKMLTETDGQYLELMVGAYSDNQPDYSWISPGETRVFKQFWYPIKKIGGVKNANTMAAVNLERKSPESFMVGFCTTSEYKKSKVVITAENKIIQQEIIDINPSLPYLSEVKVGAAVKDTDLKVSLFDSEGHELISYSPVIAGKEDKPLPVEIPRPPKEYKSVEELYLTGLRIEQFKNAVIDPMPYYEEALSRDSLDSRVNTVLGIRSCKDGRYPEAEKYLRRAIKRNTENYTHPKDGEPFYYLGVVLQLQNRLAEANDEFWKATWYAGFQSPAYFRLAQLACREKKISEALNLVEKSIEVNNLNTAALILRAYLLRKTGEYEKSGETLKSVERIDKLDNWCAAESHFLDEVRDGKNGWNEKNAAQFKMHMEDNPEYVLELAKNYGNIGAYKEAVYILDQFKNLAENQSGFPMLSYYTGFYNLKNANYESALENFKDASKASPDYCFPWRLEEIEILETALKINPYDAMGWYYLGELLYNLNQKDKAISDWEQSAKLNEKFYYTWRNLGFAYDKVNNDLKSAMSAYDRAIIINDQDARLFAEADEIKERAGVPAADRLSFLQKHLLVAERRDDAITRLIQLYNLTGAYDKALAILTKRHFHVWEGGGSVHDLFEDANLLQGIVFLEKKQYANAIKNFQNALTYPDNLEIGEPYDQSAKVRINYFMALAYDGLDNKSLAADYFNKAAQYSNTWGLSETDCYKALALRRLGKKEESDIILQQIRKFANEQLNTTGKTDFFSKFNADVRQESRNAYYYYLLGLTYVCEGNQQQAEENFQKSVELDHTRPWASFMLQLENQNAVAMTRSTR